MRFQITTLLAAFAYTIRADVQFLKPLPGGSETSGALTVTWQESGTAPLISTLTTFTLDLMAGGDPSVPTNVVSIVSTTGTVAGGTAQLVVNPASGAIVAGEFPYYLRMTSVSATGGTMINYSSRFTITGMTLTTFAPAIQEAILALAGSTTGPIKQNNVAAAGAAPAAGAAEFAIPYSLQTGLTRYAPMQGVPPTKITAGSPTPLFPTSAFTIATTYLPTPSIVLTTTEAQTFSVSSRINTAAAASQPSDVPAGNAAQRMFLERWKD